MMKVFLILKISIYFLLLQVVEIMSARDPPMVTLPDQGILMGMYMKMFRTKMVIAYLGIPYAQPPTNERRFAPPVVDNIPRWEGIRNASQLMPDCWQNPRVAKKRHDEAFMALISRANGATTQNPSNGGATSADDNKYDEDCLFLNIYIPDAPAPPEGYAVIVWLHSGDFIHGSAADLDPFQLVFKQKVIIVTVAYRLNIFGFLTTGDGEASGNFGLMDQSAAMLWIRKNIKLFEGNDKSVTLMGHGAGATSVCFHLMSGEWSDKLFDKAIIMSGNCLYDYTVRTTADYVVALDRIAHAFGCFRRPTSKLLDCLRFVNAQILTETSPVHEWGPIIDDGLSNTTTPFIPDHPRLLVDRGFLRKVPLMIGYTDMEEVLDITTGEMVEEGISHEMYETMIMDNILNELASLDANDTCGSNNQIVLDAVHFMYKPYPPMHGTELRKRFIDFVTDRKFAAPSILLATHMAKYNMEIYMYRFDIKPQTLAAIESLPTWSGVPHRFDQIFVWGMPYWAPLAEQSQWNNTDKRVSDIIMTLWANFAKYSNPTTLGVYIRWDNFTTENPGILIIDRSFNMSDHTTLNYQSLQFWNEFYPRVINFASQCCNSTTNNANINILLITQHNKLLLFIFYSFILYFSYTIVDLNKYYLRT